MEEKRILAVVGPTASGKSGLALALATRLDGEIISCDSMQIYIGMDIGTAKPTREEQAAVRHHMIDICPPGRDYSCAEYAEEARAAAEEILSRGKLPIFCGGTGLYLDSVLSANRFAPDIPEQVRDLVAAMSAQEAFEVLEKEDPISAAQIHPNNEKRVKRALAIALGTGVPKSTWDERSRTLPPPFHATVIGLDYTDRAALYERIDRRVDLMMEQGLLEEAQRLNLRRDSTAAQAIGYKELYRYLDGEYSLEEAVELLKKNTRNYAKRQLTWFRRRKETVWLYPDREEDLTARALAVFEGQTV